MFYMLLQRNPVMTNGEQQYFWSSTEVFSTMDKCGIFSPRHSEDMVKKVVDGPKKKTVAIQDSFHFI